MTQIDPFLIAVGTLGDKCDLVGALLLRVIQKRR